ncbi:CDP-diacylglycerol--serine O-phosphatidyltransferase [Thermosulfurimonas marina]|uniref:CDP-diacylglycerol--serine O-phosphatidyltransferase n=1 Tax=Thermosulfurimonas marina TaxID=2047767 RepID=UPI001FE78345|nr:CDP-diacylglycerol--serine O-phosphatidyltransferase [Thermosulfurimonas marina]
MRKIALLPHIFTTGNLFAGFFALVSALSGKIAVASWAVLAAMICDVLDGRLARLTRSTSRFGMEYDSLCDMVSFGVAPGILAYEFALKTYGRYGWLAAFVYVACTALRLARFNVEEPGPSAYFKGLPSPAAAGLVASTVIFLKHVGAEFPVKHAALVLMIYAVSFLMISPFPYPSFKVLRFRETQLTYLLPGLILAFAVVAAEPQVTLFILFLGYALLFPLKELLLRLRPAGFRLRTKPQESPEEI